MRVKYFTVDKQGKSLTWTYGEHIIKINCEDLQKAEYYSDADIILSLAGEGRFPNKLYGYEVTGEKQFAISPPPGFHFNYLVKHPISSIAVVCCGMEKVEGWYDWHFAIDSNTGALTRLSPAY